MFLLFQIITMNNKILLWTAIPIAILVIILTNTMFRANKSQEHPVSMTGAQIREIPKVSSDIRIVVPTENQIVGQSIEVKGEARGTWFFEAAASIYVFHEDGRLLGEGIAFTTGDWMTEDFVPFKGEVILHDAPQGKGRVVFSNANPSGLGEYDRSVEVAVTFGDTQ